MRDYLGLYGGYVVTMEKDNGNYYLGFRALRVYGFGGLGFRVLGFTVQGQVAIAVVSLLRSPVLITPARPSQPTLNLPKLLYPGRPKALKTNKHLNPIHPYTSVHILTEPLHPFEKEA